MKTIARSRLRRVLHGTFAVAHVSSAHPWTDNRVHMREAASTASRHATLLIAVDSPTTVPETGVTVVTIPRRPRVRRVFISTAQAVLLAVASGARVVHLHDPELIWSVPVLRALGRAVIFDAHEDLPDQFRNRHYLSPRVHGATRVLAHAVIAVASLSNHVIAATSHTGSRYPARKTSVVHNFPRLRSAERDLPPLSTRPLRATYIGAISENRGSETMRATVDDPDFPTGWQLHLAGPFYPARLASSFVGVEESGRAIVHGLLSPESARDLLLESRIGLVVLQPTDAYRHALATKMFEYLAAGIPVIASDFPMWVDLLESLDCATFIPPNDPSALARAVRRYADDPALLERQGTNARRAAVEVFNWTTEEKTLLGVYDRLGLRDAGPSSRVS
jgi:glycosyltransferase involved in cell wall biosynthesis